MPRVLITGAAGFIGMHTSVKFLSEGWEVIGLDNMNSYYSVELKSDRIKVIKKYSKSLNVKFKIYEEDLNSDIWETLKHYKFDVVIHLAAQAGVRYSLENPIAYIDSNIRGFQKVLNFIEEEKIGRFIYASSSSVYGMSSALPFKETHPCNKPVSLYAATKLSNEMMAYAYYKTKGIKSIGLRFFTVYGPWGRPDMAPMIFAKSILENEQIKVFNNANQTRDFTYVGDVVNGIYLITAKFDEEVKSEVINIGRGKPTSLSGFIRTIENELGKKAIKKMMPHQPGDVRDTYCDVTRFENLTNYSAAYSLEEGIKNFITWYLEYYKIS